MGILGNSSKVLKFFFNFNNDNMYYILKKIVYFCCWNMVEEFWKFIN